MDKARNKSDQFFHQEVYFADSSEPIQERVSTSFATHHINPFTSHTYEPSSSTIYNSQVNNQFPEQSPIASFIVPSLNVIPNVVLNVQKPLNHLFPRNASNRSFNPNVWDVPPVEQIHCNPNLPVNVQLNNQGHPLINVKFKHGSFPSDNDPFNNLRLPLNLLFHNQVSPAFMPSINQGQPINVQFNNQDIPVPSKQNIPRSISPRFQRRRSFHDSPHQHHRKKQNFGELNKSSPYQTNFPKFDLREVLSAKKIQRQKYQPDNAQAVQEPDDDCNRNSKNEQEDYNIPSKEYAQLETNTHNEELVNEEADGDWIEEHIFVGDKQIRLNVTNLKRLAKSDMDTYPWYIVADKDIMLNHLNFLNILCNSDENCCLMVPQKVLVELQESKEDADRHIAYRAKRAVSFLLQHVDGKSVVVGDANCGETSTRCDYLLNCCANLLEQNHHVILLSEDEDFNLLKDGSEISIFNIKELKQVLSKSGIINVKKDRIKAPPCVNPKLIKIVVPNDLAIKPSTEIIHKENTQLNVDMFKQETADFLSQKSDSSIKYTIRPGVIDTNENKLNKTNNEASPKSSSSFVDNETIFSANTASSTNQNNLKKTIRLSRSISIKNSASVKENPPKGETKQVRWRRKKVASDSCSNVSLASYSNVGENSRFFAHEECAPSSYAPTSTFNDPGKHQKFVSDDYFLSDFSSFKSRNKPNENVVLKETVTSGNIPNTTSSADSEIGSGCQNRKKITLKQPPKQLKQFKVKDQRMEHSLRVMNDEWLSRIMQIMEEMLTQVMRKDKKFLYEVVYKLHGGGPWTILEATECIKIKYKDHCDILDVASKLSSMLSKISDSAGRIIVILNPSEFMEMYSYSVHLVEALTSALGYCEDLYAASQSLSKLLKDIKEPNLSSSGNDFVDHNRKQDRHIGRLSQSPKEKVKSSTVTPSPQKTTTPPNQIIQLSPQIMSSKINMASHKSKSELRTPEKSYQDKDTQNMLKPVQYYMEHPVHSIRDSLSTPDIARTKTSIISAPANQNRSEPLPSTDGKAKVESQPFEKNKEERNRIPVERETLDMDQLDYSEYYENDDDDISEDNMENDQNSDEIDSKNEIDSYKFITPETSLAQFKPNDMNECGNSENTSTINNTLNCIFSRVIADVKESILHIQTFCENTARELSGSVFSSKRKCELHEKTEKAQVMIDDLCKSLNSVYCRETYEPGNNIQALLRKAGVNSLDSNSYLVDLYRDVIGNISEQAKILQESVAGLIMVIRKKPIS